MARLCCDYLARVETGEPTATRGSVTTPTKRRENRIGPRWHTARNDLEHMTNKNEAETQSNVEIIRDQYVCTDCALALANGETHEDPAREAAIIAGQERVFPAHFASDDDGSEPFFSWRMCACCHSTLGGDRHRYALITTNTAR